MSLSAGRPVEFSFSSLREYRAYDIIFFINLSYIFIFCLDITVSRRTFSLLLYENESLWSD